MPTKAQKEYWNSLKGRKVTGTRKTGWKLTEQQRKNIGKGHLGQVHPPITEITRKKLSDSHKGYVMPEGQKIKIGLKSRGRKHSLKTLKQMSDSRKGENNPMWQGGKTEKHLLIRMSLEYRLWRKAVYERDNYTCIWCGDNKGNNLEADHIKPFYLFPELRFAIDNGRTLCIECHKTTKTYGRPKISERIPRKGV